MFMVGNVVRYLGGGSRELDHTPGFSNVWTLAMDDRLTVGGLYTVVDTSVSGLRIAGVNFQWPPAVFASVSDEPEQRYIIWNETTNRFYAVPHSQLDSVTYDQGVRLIREAVIRHPTRVFHLIPLRSITKVSMVDGLEDFR